LDLPTQLTFRGLAPSDFVATHVGKRATELHTVCNRIVSCRVTLESPPSHVFYRVLVEISVPSAIIILGRNVSPSSNDIRAAIDAVFDDATCRLRNYASAHAVRRSSARHEW
jgi:ribosome-associated translation inhibitor RaiA